MAQPFPAAVQNQDRSGGHQGIYTGSIGSGQSSVQGAALPPPAASPSHRMADGRGHVTLKRGETIYTLSRRYNVPADAIMRANGISSASDVTAGREIVIPGYDGGGSPAASAGKRQPHLADARPAARPLESDVRGHSQRVAVLSDNGAARVEKSGGDHQLHVPTHLAHEKRGGSYVVQSGDTLAAISRRTNVSIDALKSANSLSGSTIRVGQTLVLPHGASAVAKATPARAAPTKEVVTGSVPKASPQPKAVKVAEAAPKAGTEDVAPKSYTPPRKEEDSVAATQSSAKVASLTPESSGIGKLRWPARGHVVSRFGSSDDGHRNDGIDISVPEGTPVKAAENGVVIYSGNGLKEYGNTVLIRHDNGLVTVYGYAKDLKVKRGDKVTRGEVIADSGMSGEANRPKLHFEVRKDATPVDPMSYLD